MRARHAEPHQLQRGYIRGLQPSARGGEPQPQIQTPEARGQLLQTLSLRPRTRADAVTQAELQLVHALLLAPDVAMQYSRCPFHTLLVQTPGCHREAIPNKLQQLMLRQSDLFEDLLLCANRQFCG